MAKPLVDRCIYTTSQGHRVRHMKQIRKQALYFEDGLFPPSFKSATVKSVSYAFHRRKLIGLCIIDHNEWRKLYKHQFLIGYVGIFVAPAYRKEGIGRRLVEKVYPRLKRSLRPIDAQFVIYAADFLWPTYERVFQGFRYRTLYV